VRNCHIFQRDGNHLVSREFAAALDGIRNFARFAQRITDLAALVADDDERAEIETASAFDNFRRAVDEDNLLHQFFAAAAKIIFRSVRTATSAASATTLPARAALSFTTRFVDFSHSIFFRLKF